MEVHLYSFLGRFFYLVVDIHHIVFVKFLEGYLGALRGLFSDIKCLTVVAEMQVGVFSVLKAHPFATELAFLED